jgi:hypothetical protein
MRRLLTSPHSQDRRVTVCMPYFGCRRYLRRAIVSILAQTHRDITLVVVNDGDPEPPWDLLGDIQDPRLVRFSLLANHGPYFATAIALNATSAPYFMIQDADDWSSPGRAACLLDRLERDDSDLAVSAQPQYTENGRGRQVLDVRWATVSTNGIPKHSFAINYKLTSSFSYRAPHHGLFRTDSIRRVGGYYGGFRVGYDTLLTNFILMTGRISHVPQHLYYRLVRPESLTHSSSTGLMSATARQVSNTLASLYRCCFASYLEYLAGRLDSSQLSHTIRSYAVQNVTADDSRQLGLETQRLKCLLRKRRIEPG